MEKEQWSKVPGHPFYEVSNYGRARSIDRTINQENGPHHYRGKIMSLHVDRNGKGYLSFLIKGKDVKDVRVRIHRLVGKLFVHNPNNNPEINHKDGDPRNNNADNIEWVTHAQNQHHAGMNGSMSHGEKHRCAKLTDIDVLEIRRIGHSIRGSILARKLGVSRSTISEVLSMKRWKHLG